MNEFDEKAQTFKFDPVKEEKIQEKPQQNRRENDEFSAARKGYGDYEQSYSGKKEKGNGGLIAIACILTVILVVVIVGGIFILKNDNNPQLPAGEEVTPSLPEEEIPEEIPEVMNASVLCNIVFYSDSIMVNDGEYTILADLYDDQMYKFESKKLIIGKETDIRQDGVRITPQAFSYIIENTGGEKIVYEGEVRERDGVVLAISFESLFEEEPEEDDEEENQEEDETLSDVIKPDSEENNEPAPETAPEAEPPAQPVPEEPQEAPAEET